MISVKIPTPPLFNYFFSGALKPTLLLGITSISLVGLATNVNENNNELSKQVETITKKANEIVKFDQIESGTKKLFDSLSEWSKLSINKATEFGEKVKKHLKLEQLQNGSRMMYVTLNNWVQELGKLFSKVTKLNLVEIRDWIAKYGNRAINLLSILKNIFDSRGGDTLLINKLFETAGNEKFDEFATSMGDLMQKKPEVLDDLGSEGVEKILDAFNGKSENTLEILNDLANGDSPVKAQDVEEALKMNTLEHRAAIYLEKAKKIQENPDKVNQEELKETLRGLKGVLDEITAITSKAKT